MTWEQIVRSMRRLGQERVLPDQFVKRTVQALHTLGSADHAATTATDAAGTADVITIAAAAGHVPQSLPGR